MHDLRWIRENPEAFDAGLKRRGAAPLSAQILDIDKRRRALQTRLQEIQTRRNPASKEIGALRSKGGDAAALMDEVNRLKTTERPAVIKAIAAAREHGDLSENAEYHAARERQGFIEGEWGATEENRRAKFYTLTRSGRTALRAEATAFNQYVAAVHKVMQPA